MLAGVPPLPPEGPRAWAPVPLRFEDVTQDGRLVLEALPAALATSVWQGIVAKSDELGVLSARGILPILTRLRMEGTQGPFASNARVQAEGTLQLALADDGRFVLDMWADVYAPIGRTYEPVEGGGRRALAGRVFAEHVLTRPFAPPSQRRVTSLDFPGAPAVTARRAALARHESSAAVPPGAKALETTARVDPVGIAFGIVHTDSNKHVNSLAYLRVFEEAALRRFVSLGLASNVLARSVDIAYRKPCFAGQTMRVVQQAFEYGGKLGMTAALVTEADAAGGDDFAAMRPHTYVWMAFEP